MKQIEKSESSRYKIVGAAMCEFGSKGYAASSINTVCASGIPKGLVYHNFKNKDEIYLACVKKCFAELASYLQKADIGKDYEKYISARLAFFKENKNEARIFFDATLQPPEQLWDEIQNLRAELDKLNQDICLQILDSVTLRNDISQVEAMDYLDLFQTMFNSYFSSPACKRMSFEEKINVHEERLSKLLEIMFYGIAERRS